MKDNTYKELLQELKNHIIKTRREAVYAVNRQLMDLYWQIGKRIVEKQESEGWGKSVVEKLAQDLQQALDNARGFSAQNLWYMRQFYLTYKDFPILQQLAGEIPWMHNVLIFTKIKEIHAQEYYLSSSGQLGWSRNVLLNKIKANAYEQYLDSPVQSNFHQVLPQHLAEQAQEVIRGEYFLDFLGLTEPMLERDLEKKLIEHIKSFLLELGRGFAFLGNQYKIRLGDNEYFIDLLFYHRSLKCLIAIELKTGKFKPEYAGKMNFYLEILDEKEKLPSENPAIGIILCAEKDTIEVEYSLRTANKPMGVAEYTLTANLPEDMQKELPSTDEIKSAIQKWAE